MGIWGKEGAELMDKDVKDKILNRPRAKEIAGRPYPTDTLEELRKKYGGKNDEELLLRFFSSKDDVDRMYAAGPARSYSSAGNPLVNLIGELSKQKDRSSVFVQRPGFTLRMQRRSAV